MRDRGDVLEVRCSRRYQGVGWWCALVCGGVIMTLVWILVAHDDMGLRETASVLATCVPFAGFGIAASMPCLRPWIRCDRLAITVGIWRPRRVPWTEITTVRALPRSLTSSARIEITTASGAVWCRPGSLFSRSPRQLETQMNEIATVLVDFAHRQGAMVHV